jgi:hypothetical protein
MRQPERQRYWIACTTLPGDLYEVLPQVKYSP